jgi:LmbE family N-acetylglucosaminyl deacetylase
MPITSSPLAVTPASRYVDAWSTRIGAATPVSPQDLLGLGRGDTVLAVVAHPDDETLAMGSMLAALHASAIETHVLCLTRGEAALAHLDRQAEGLAARRRAELEAAAALLGVSGVHVGTCPDGALLTARQDAARTTAELATQLRPRALLTLWRDDPHPDHGAAALVADEVATTRSVPLVEMPLWALHWTDPDAVPQDIRPLRVQASARAAKRRALAEYRTQTEPLADDLEPVLPPSVVRWPHECVVMS